MRRRGEVDAAPRDACVCATRCERRVRWRRWRHDAVRARVCGAARRRRRGFRAVDVYISGVIESPWLTSYDQKRRQRSLTRESCARRERQRGEGAARRAKTSTPVRACENACVVARVCVHSAHVDDQETARNRTSRFLIFIFDDDGFRAVVV
jgi:hypothetical protein